MAITWKQVDKKYLGIVETCFLGTVKVGECNYNQFKSKGEIGVDYTYMIYLPGFANPKGNAATIEAAKEKIELMVDNWLHAACLKNKN